MSMVQCNVSGLESEDDKAHIKNALNKVEGVRKVAVNLMSGTLEINYNEPATENLIKKCVEESGYNVIN